MSSHLVAAAMGHESDRTTTGGSYATGGAIASAKQKRALTVLKGGRAA